MRLRVVQNISISGDYRAKKPMMKPHRSTSLPRRTAVRRLLSIVPCLSVLAQTHSSMAPPVVLVIVGPPGSGKTVQARLLSKRYSIPAVAISDLLQANMGKRRQIPDSLRAQVSSGDLAGDELANELVRARLARGDARRGIILDGYPRTAQQGRYLDQALQTQGLPLPKVILLEAPDDVVRNRMRSRRRDDDQPAMIEQRLREFHEDFQFLADWYKPENMLRVDATEPPEVVNRKVNDLIDEQLSKHSFSVR